MPADVPPALHAGLCDDCRHQRVITSAKGSAFSMCKKHDEDPRYRKYPPLPVLRCQGYVRRDADAEG
jgi:hypothetical protein